MNAFLTTPLSLYIHMPWCVRKCPYCDFNSHELKKDLPETAYIDALLRDLVLDLSMVGERKLRSIFIGGGTPSLFSPAAIENLLSEIQKHIPFEDDIEITLEANPGTVEQSRFEGFRKASVNRLSIGVQSFNDLHLKSLGRIHDSDTAKRAIEAAQRAGFNNINIDLMFGLPQQTEAQALADLAQAIQFNTTHLSWYQLTIEPNTLFHHHPPVLPIDDTIWSMQQAGQAFLSAHSFNQYEISAYSQKNQHCDHNLNYWTFGDYLGIGAGAHGKITDPVTGKIKRAWKTRHPKTYLDSCTSFVQGIQELNKNDLILEFMLNALRLHQPISLSLFEERTGISKTELRIQLDRAQEKGLLTVNDNLIETTALGKQHLNELLVIFS